MVTLLPEIKSQTIIGKNLKEIRESRGITQQALAMALGITLQQVQKYEKGQSGFSAARLFVLSRILHSTYENFFMSIDDPIAIITPPAPLSPAILLRALKIQKTDSPHERAKILKIIDLLTA